MKGKFKQLSKTKQSLIKLIIKIVIIFIIILLLKTFVIDIGVVHDNMNYPNLKDGDLSIIYKLSNYDSGDLIKYNYDDNIYYGRIVGIGEDKITITDSSYLINGTLPYETIYFKTEPKDNITYPYIVPENSVFVLCDYREDGLDSRDIGCIDINNIEGKIIFIFRSRGI